jgi:hypothetical protein
MSIDDVDSSALDVLPADTPMSFTEAIVMLNNERGVAELLKLIVIKKLVILL